MNINARVATLFFFSLSVVSNTVYGIVDFGHRHYSNIVKPERQFGTYGYSADELNTPLSVAVAKNRIYIADYKNHRVQIRNFSGKFITNIDGAQSTGMRMKFPASVQIDDGKLYVADKGNARLLAFDEDGRYLQALSLRTPDGEPIEPYYFSRRNGSFVVIPFESSDMFLFGSDGHFSRVELPREIEGLPFDPGGVLYSSDQILVTDSASGRIATFSQKGEFVEIHGAWGSRPSLLATPQGMSSAGGLLFVADQVNHRIQVFDIRNMAFLFQWGRHPTTGHEGWGRVHYPGSLSVTEDLAKAVTCEPIEHRCQVFDLSAFSTTPVESVAETAWWEKRGRFHYGKRPVVKGNTLVITEQDTHAVLAFDISKDTPHLIRKFGGFGGDFGSFVMPSGAFIEDDEKNIRVSDRGNNRIQTYRILKSDVGGPVAAAGLELSNVVDLKSTLSQADFDQSVYDPKRADPGPQLELKDGSRIVVDVSQGAFLYVDKSYRLTRPPILIERGPNGFHRKPVSAVLSRDEEHVIFVDPWNYQIVTVNLEGKVVSQWGEPGPNPSQFLFPFGIAIDRDGNIFVSDTGKHAIKKFSPTGDFIKEFGSYGAGQGQFYKPKGIAYHENKSHIYVSDFGNHRAQVWTTDGEYVRDFGIGEQYVPATPKLSVRQVLPSRVQIPPQGSLADRDKELGALSNMPLTEKGFNLRNVEAAEFFSVDGKYKVSLPGGLPPLKSKKPVSLEMVLFNAHSGTVVDAEVYVSANMPVHGHGLAEAIETGKDGHKLVTNSFSFSMPGEWDLEVYINDKGMWSRASTGLRVE